MNTELKYGIKLRQEMFGPTNANVIINQNLICYNKVKDFVAHHHGIENFGNTIGSLQPDDFVLVFGPEIKACFLKALIVELLKYGLTHIGLKKDYQEYFWENTIVIGAYSRKHALKLTSPLLTEINSLESAEEIFSFVKSKMQKTDKAIT